MTSRNALIFLLGFLGVGAIMGGGSLVISPSGTLLGVPLSMLEHSPFSNFTIPGFILFLILGVLPIVVIYALIKKTSSNLAEYINIFKDMHWAWSFSMYIAIALIVWIQIQEIMIQSVYWLHSLYMLVSLLILITGLSPSVRKRYQK